MAALWPLWQKKRAELTNIHNAAVAALQRAAPHDLLSRCPLVATISQSLGLRVPQAQFSEPADSAVPRVDADAGTLHSPAIFGTGTANCGTPERSRHAGAQQQCTLARKDSAPERASTCVHAEGSGRMLPEQQAQGMNAGLAAVGRDEVGRMHEPRAAAQAIPPGLRSSQVFQPGQTLEYTLGDFGFARPTPIRRAGAAAELAGDNVARGGIQGGVAVGGMQGQDAEATAKVEAALRALRWAHDAAARQVTDFMFFLVLPGEVLRPEQVMRLFWQQLCAGAGPVDVMRLCLQAVQEQQRVEAFSGVQQMAI